MTFFYITHMKIQLIFFILVLSLFLMSFELRSNEDCQEYITIEDLQYLLPERWCGKLIDSLLMPETSELVKIADSLTFEDYRIYLLPQTKAALNEMSEAAKKDSVLLIVDSGFRSKSFQKRIIKERMLSGEPYEKVINYVAPPGYSQHHTGRAIDFVPSVALFANSDTYRWLKENAARYGFVETYGEDSTGVIPWESWHWYLEPASEND